MGFGDKMLSRPKLFTFYFIYVLYKIFKSIKSCLISTFISLTFLQSHWKLQWHHFYAISILICIARNTSNNGNVMCDFLKINFLKTLKCWWRIKKYLQVIYFCDTQWDCDNYLNISEHTYISTYTLSKWLTEILKLKYSNNTLSISGYVIVFWSGDWKKRFHSFNHAFFWSLNLKNKIINDFTNGCLVCTMTSNLINYS